MISTRSSYLGTWKLAIQRTYVICAQETIDNMIDEVIMKPLGFTKNPFALESQTFWDCAAASVLGSTLNANAIEIPNIEAVQNHRPAAGRHDTLPLMRRIQPIGQDCRAVWPINSHMIDRAAKSPLEPNTRPKPPIVRILLQPDRDGFCDIALLTQQVHPRKPRSQMLPIGIKKLEELPGVLMLYQAQLSLIINGTVKHQLPGKSRNAEARRDGRGVGNVVRDNSLSRYIQFVAITTNCRTRGCVIRLSGCRSAAGTVMMVMPFVDWFKVGLQTCKGFLRT